MSFEKDTFSLSGPCHLNSNSINWKDIDQRRAVIASLVRGVSAMERDRQKRRRHGPHSLAPPWWESFNFELYEKLADPGDSTIYGAVYRFRPPAIPSDRIPSYVAAFRGTILGKGSIRRDIKYDAMCVVHTLHNSSRFKDAMKRVEGLVEAVGAANIWVAGHSLGSAIAMLVGKVMARSGFFLESYLFNPPFISLPIERIKSTRLRHIIHTTSSAVKAGLAVVLKAVADRPLEDGHFAALSGWVPHIFVNENDPVCSGYIGYFENRRNMETIGAGQMGIIATQTTFGSLISGAIGRDWKPLDILPSAHLTVNSNRYRNQKKAHGIKQWWDKDSSAKCVQSIHQL